MKKSPNRFSSTLALVAPTAALLASNADAGLFVKFDGIDGESSLKGHEKWIELNSWSWGMSNSGSQASAGGGAGTGKVSISSFNIMHRIDKASPLLFLRCAQGQHIATATLSFTRTMSNGTEMEYYRIGLGDVVVGSINGNTPPPPAAGTTGGDDRPTESLSLNFQKIRFDYTPINDVTGQAGPVVSATASFSPPQH